MNRQASVSPPSSDKARDMQAAEEEARDALQRPTGPYVGHPLDGSQYVDVVEEQEYADRRPTQEEQQPRYSYRKEEPQRTKPYPEKDKQ